MRMKRNPITSSAADSTSHEAHPAIKLIADAHLFNHLTIVNTEMSVKDNKVTWITCPDCGSKIGIVISVGKEAPVVVHEEPEAKEWPPEEVDFKTKLEAAGVDLALVDVEQSEGTLTVSPKKFLGDLWGPINDAMRELGGTWIRNGRNSRWEITLEEPED
jgi:hypothetical protein